MPAYFDREELAWAAGFYDGEGSTTMQNANAKRPRDYLTPSLSISQHGSPECLLRLQAALHGLGTIHGPYTYPERYTGERWTWSARRHEDALAALACLWPWLSSPKREQAARVFNAYNADRMNNPRRMWRRSNTQPKGA